MEIVLGIAVFLVCAHGGVEAQSPYIPQQVRYDDEVPSYGETHYQSSDDPKPASSPQETNLRTEGSPYPQPEHFHPTTTRDQSEKAPHHQPAPVVFYRQPESTQPEELQLSGHAEHPRPTHSSLVYPQTSSNAQPLAHQPPSNLLVRDPTHTSVVYPYPSSNARPAEPLVHQPPSNQVVRDPTHTSVVYPQPSSNVRPAEPLAHQPPSNRVVRDPRLPLYFTMYEKRIVQDPVDKYGKGPWRYLTYGHGITYGSKEPGKVFERGYGYIRALGRDHCKLPENRCPRKDDGKPFEYEGRKEPYFGYRPH